MIDSLINSIAGEVFTPEGITHPSMNIPHAQMVSNAYGYKTRTWVGLTEAQCGVLWKTNMTPFEYYQAIEAKLKEKNNV